MIARIIIRWFAARRNRSLWSCQIDTIGEGPRVQQVTVAVIVKITKSGFGASNLCKRTDQYED